jgi:hypothetical protein
VIAVIATALLTPRGIAIIPLTVNYTVGEKMIYNSTETMTTQVGNTTIAAGQMEPTPSTIICNSTESVEVIDFDGEYYTLNHTVTLIMEQWSPISFSFVEIVNKTGFSSYFSSVGTQQLVFNASSDPLSSYSFISALLARPEVKVGDTWQVPMSTGNSSFACMHGNLTVTFGGIQDITVPAGTYEVFKIDFSSNNLSMSLNFPANATGTNVPTTLNMSISGQKYLEYKTCREIESNIEMTHSYQVGELNFYCSCSSQRKLVEHLQG